MPNFIVSTDWKWQSSTLPIKKLIRNQEQNDEQIIYQVVSCDIETNSNQKVKIWLDKDFPFEKNVGFVWHKSWNLPEIKVTLDEYEMQTLREEYEQLFCEAMAVYPVKNNKFYYLQEVGLGGNNVQKFNQNCVQLKFLKFSATSFNYNRNKFCLLLLIRGENSSGDIHDLYSLISSPIYVDSRKEARKKVQKGITLLLSQSPKKFFTPIGSRKNSQFNNSQGFLNYYGAQNIRNKIKHFFYLGLHFDKVFNLYRNSNSELTLEEILEAINIPNKLKQTLLLVVINVEGDKEKKKILNMVERWKYNYVQFAYSDTPVSKRWVPITKQQIKTSYKSYYEKQLLKEEDEQNDLEEDDQSDKQKIKKPEQKREFELRTVIELNKGGRLMKFEQNSEE